MKILLLGACDSGNLGDPVICDCVAAWLRSHFPFARLTVRDVYRREPRQTSPEPERKALRLADFKQQVIRCATGLGIDLTCWHEERRLAASAAYIRQTCSGDYDAVVFAGGQMFMDRYALFLEAHVREFEVRGVPVFFNACGTGPANSRRIAGHLKRTLGSPCVQYISCRDDVDLVNARYAGGIPAQATFDPALTAAQVYGVRRDEQADTVGLGVIGNIAVEHGAQLRFWQDLIRLLEGRGIKWQLFTNGDPADMTTAREILESMPECRGREADLLHPRDTEPEALVRTIAGYRGIISFRLHSHIIAASLDVPSVAMVWDDKLPYFFGKIGHLERCFTLDNTPGAVLEALKRAEKEGYDRSLLRSQAETAEEQLIRAMEAQRSQS